jgi:hypothetical protein
MHKKLPSLITHPMGCAAPVHLDHTVFPIALVDHGQSIGRPSLIMLVDSGTGAVLAQRVSLAKPNTDAVRQLLDLYQTTQGGSK